MAANTTQLLRDILALVTNLTSQTAQIQTQIITAISSSLVVVTPPVVVAPSLTPSAVALSTSNLTLGQTITGTATFKNDSDKDVVLQQLVVAFRGPGATHSGGPFTDAAPTLSNVTVAAGATVSLAATRTFTAADAVGTWETYATSQVAGTWKDGKSSSLAVKAAVTPTPTPDPTTPADPSGPVTGVGGKFYLGTQSGYVAAWAGNKIYKDGVNWATAYASGDNIWNPAYLADLVGYGCIRHMDSNSVNFSKITSWSQRKQPNDPKNAEIYIDNQSPPGQTGMAVEWQIDLCNKANVNCWLTHPYLADDDYIRQQALLAKAKLKPGLRLYIELSNEVWNSGFFAFQQAISAGQTLGLPGMNQYYQGIAHEMYRALQMYQIYSDVFGADQMGSRVVRVFSESGNLDETTVALKNVYQSPKWNPKGQKIDMIAIAPYVGGGWDGAAFNMTQWKSDILAKVAGEPIAQAKAHMAANGIKYLGSYEFGQSFYKNSDQFAKNPLAYDAYTFMLDQWAANMNEVANHYTVHGTWAASAFGAFDHVGQDINQAPKARALHDWIVKHK